MFSLSRGAHRGVAPFIIADETGRDERVPRERSHANGVTGVGTLTPLGANFRAFADALLQGRSAIARVVHYDVTDQPSQVAR